MGELLFFDQTLRCSAYTNAQIELFHDYVVLPGDTGLISDDLPGEWIVLVGNALLIVRKDSEGIRFAT
jgi:hypothetical protein